MDRILVLDIKMMQRLLPALLSVWIDYGTDEGWGPLCYPPMQSAH